MKKRTIKKWLLALVAVLIVTSLLAGCGAKKSTQESAIGMMSGSASAPSSPPMASTAQRDEAGYDVADNKIQTSTSSGSIVPGDVERKIIRNATIEQKVTDLDAAMEVVNQLVADSNGFVQSSSTLVYSERERVAEYVLRIPTGSYTDVVMQLRLIGKNVRIDERGQDVTEEYYDNEARIKNLKLQEEAVQRLFDKAERMEDILAIQRELFQIRGEIEAYEGRNRYLDNLTSLSTIELYIREVKPVEYLQDHSDSALSRAKEGFMDTLRQMGNFFVETFVFVVSSLPTLILGALLLIIVVWGVIKWRKKRSIAKTVTAVREDEGDKSQQ